MSDIIVIGVITAAATSSTAQTRAAPPSTSEIRSAPSSTSKTLPSPPATASPTKQSNTSTTSEALSSLPATASLTNQSNTSTTSETLPSLPATASPTNQSTTRISRGAIAGIGVGVLASLLIGMAIILSYHYYTRHHRAVQLRSSQTSLSAQIQALNVLRPDNPVPRTTSNFGWMPRELPVSGSVHTQQELPTSGTVEMQQIGSSKTHQTARPPKIT